MRKACAQLKISTKFNSMEIRIKKAEDAAQPVITRSSNRLDQKIADAEEPRQRPNDAAGEIRLRRSRTEGHQPLHERVRQPVHTERTRPELCAVSSAPPTLSQGK